MKPFSKILFPVDFSAATVAMVPYAVDMAQRFNATVTLLNAFDLVRDYGIAPHSEGMADVESVTIPYSPQLHELRKKRERSLEEFAHAHFSNVIGEPTVGDGDPATVIEWVAKRDHTDLIMMPTKGAGKFRRLVLGSITTKILHDLSCPVFTTAHEPDHALSTPLVYRSIVCAVELNPEADAVFKMAGLLAQACGARICLLHVEHSTPANGGQTLSEMVRHGYENAVSVGDTRIGMQPIIRILDASLPECIRRIAIEEAADLVIVGRGHEKGNFSRIWSQLYTIIRESPCPVLSV